MGAPSDVDSISARRRGNPADSLAEYDPEETVPPREAALRGAGHGARRLGGGRHFLDAMLAGPPDLVFNLAEGRGGRAREAQVPAGCEMLGVPRPHSDALTMAGTPRKARPQRPGAPAPLPHPGFAKL